MIIFGHSAIETPRFIRIERIEDIAHTQASDIVWLECDREYRIANHCKKHNIAYAARIHSIKEIMLFANLDATYIMTDNQALLESAQALAHEYFFDSKILKLITHEYEIEHAARLGIDGVIFAHILQ